MQKNLKIELDSQQRDYLLAGLRFVRSSIALDIQDWSEEVEDRRQRQYGDLDSLEAMLGGVPAGDRAARV
ncbi:MAG: hypothetical protein KF861_14610 [Planctomycetaceae bacterium]|nr:hypothetical protein [Planctomycetaceae bacterium]